MLLKYFSRKYETPWIYVVVYIRYIHKVDGAGKKKSEHVDTWLAVVSGGVRYVCFSLDNIQLVKKYYC